MTAGRVYQQAIPMKARYSTTHIIVALVLMVFAALIAADLWNAAFAQPCPGEPRCYPGGGEGPVAGTWSYASKANYLTLAVGYILKDLGFQKNWPVYEDYADRLEEAVIASRKAFGAQKYGRKGVARPKARVVAAMPNIEEANTVLDQLLAAKHGHGLPVERPQAMR